LLSQLGANLGLTRPIALEVFFEGAGLQASILRGLTASGRSGAVGRNGKLADPASMRHAENVLRRRFDE
jgi:hypothetical protein